MIVIDSSYFFSGPLKIPNAVSGNAGDSVSSDLDAIGKEYERQLLIDALGVTQYSKLETALSDFPNADQKWKDLVSGVTYQVDGVAVIWDGLRGKNKDGLVANYVYCQYLKHDEITYTTTGMGRSSVKNSTLASFTPKYVSAWSSFLKQYQGEKPYQRSLYQFLEDNEATYTVDLDDFRKYSPVNRFGL